MLNMENYKRADMIYEGTMISVDHNDVVMLKDFVVDYVNKAMAKADEEEKNDFSEQCEAIKKLADMTGDAVIFEPELYIPKDIDEETWDPKDDDKVNFMIKVPVYLVLDCTMRDIIDYTGYPDEEEHEEE